MVRTSRLLYSVNQCRDLESLILTALCQCVRPVGHKSHNACMFRDQLHACGGRCMWTPPGLVMRYRPKESVVPAVGQVPCMDITWTPQLDVRAYYPCSPACLPACCYPSHCIRRVSSSSLFCNLIHVYPVWLPLAVPFPRLAMTQGFMHDRDLCMRRSGTSCNFVNESQNRLAVNGGSAVQTLSQRCFLYRF